MTTPRIVITRNPIHPLISVSSSNISLKGLLKPFKTHLIKAPGYLKIIRIITSIINSHIVSMYHIYLEHFISQAKHIG
jgi:hypothetical protein